MDLLLGIVTYRACIEQHGVGHVYIVGHHISHGIHHRSHDLTVGYVHLASVGFYIQALIGMRPCIVILFHLLFLYS